MLSKTKLNKPKEKQKITPQMIKDVFEDNFLEEIRRLGAVLDKYKYMSMVEENIKIQDTEFPGVVFQPANNSREAYYRSVKKNVDTLKLIQVGITLCDDDGNYPTDTATWQFNLKFDLNVDQYSYESISLLTSSGINFDILAARGINPEIFGEYLITSGLLLNDDLHWVSFHGIYDFAYLLKIITNLPLPEAEPNFFEILRMYFPHYYDIRYLVRYTDNFRGSLSKLGQELNINRIGIQHQAGSDSIVTSEVFFKLKSDFLTEDLIKGDKNVLFGLGLGNEETELGFNNTYYPGNNSYKAPNNTANYNNYDQFTSSSFYPQNLMNLQYPYMRNPSYFPQNVSGSTVNPINNVSNTNNNYSFPYNGYNQVNMPYQINSSLVGTNNDKKKFNNFAED